MHDPHFAGELNRDAPFARVVFDEEPKFDEEVLVADSERIAAKALRLRVEGLCDRLAVVPTLMVSIE